MLGCDYKLTGITASGTSVNCQRKVSVDLWYDIILNYAMLT